MPTSVRFARTFLLAFFTVVLFACANQMEPAQKAIADVEGAVASVSDVALKYAPRQLQDVLGKVAGLKEAFGRKDYAAVLAQAPAVLAAAQALGSTANANKAEALKVLNSQWSQLANSLPDAVMNIEKRIDHLNSKAGAKQAAGIDLPAAKAALGAINSLWSKAQGAFASGNLEEAVNAAGDVKTKVDALAAAIKMPHAPAT